MFLAFVGLVIGVALIAVGIAADMSAVSEIILIVAGGFVIFVTALITIFTKLYRKTTADEAFVRTGMGKAKVVLDGGSLVVPVIHRLVPVSLTTMRLDVVRMGEEALITGDSLRVDIKAEFFIKVQPVMEDILNAARSLGVKSISAESISDLIMEKLISALRTVAATKTLIELHTKRDEFAAAVQQIVTNDLQENGLTLETVTISSLDQTPLEILKDDNIFDAQGKRRITEVTQDQLVRRNEIERDAERNIRDKDVDTRKKILDLDKDREVAEATQARDVANVQAQRKRETDEFAIQQTQEVELAAVGKELAVQDADIAKNRDLAVANAQRERAERLAQIERDKAQQEADVEREKTVKVAQRQAEVAVAEEETRRAQTQAQTRAAEAQREEEAQRIETIKVTTEADRRAEQKMITEKQQVDIKRYEDQIEADVKAYTAVKVAEGELEAADKQKEAMLILAEGDSESNKRRAEGQRAKDMVPVQVDVETVKVEAARVEVRRQDLENQENFSKAALDFEIKKIQIEANKAVQVEMANAVGKMLSSADMQIFGDPTTVSEMTQTFLKSVGWGLTVDGLLSSTPKGVQDAAKKLLSGAGGVVQKLTDRIAKGTGVDPATIEKAVAEAMEKFTGEPAAAPPEGDKKDKGGEEKKKA